MIKKIEAVTLEEAYKDAAAALECSVTELVVEIVQAPSSGVFGLFKKNAIIVATVKSDAVAKTEPKQGAAADEKVAAPKPETPKKSVSVEEKKLQEPVETPVVKQQVLNDTIMPESFVSDQDEELSEDLASGLDYTADYDDAFDEQEQTEEQHHSITAAEAAKEVEAEINRLFGLTCFTIDPISVRAYDEETLLVEFSGEDAALLIGKEGYRYKALSYMIFNWVNAKYNLQLRLEIAEFLKNQEESVNRYLESVYESVEREGRAQTKILDGVLVQIALKALRERYPEKYVAIRTTRDGLKYVLVNDYNY